MRSITLLSLIAAVLYLPADARDTSGRHSSFRKFTWKSVTIGAKASYKMDIEIELGAGGAKHVMSYSVDIVVKDKDEKEVTLEYVYNMPGGAISKNTVKQPIDGDGFSLYGAMTKGAKLKAEGREVLEFNGRKIPCFWREYDFTTGGQIMKIKVWTSSHIPTGTVKSVISADGGTKYKMKMYLESFDRK